MLYNPPLDQIANPNAPYVDGNPAAGIQGSIVPAASLEFDQREVVEVITRANARGYVDFSDVPCAVPANSDLAQLRKAIEGFIRGWDFIIDDVRTYTVHGPGANFPDLIAAMSFLRRYYITPQGHVILQLAAGKWTYTQTVDFVHPNNNRISVLGATILAQVPRQLASYAINGSSAPTRATDTATNLAMLRTKFATELYFSGCGSGFRIGPGYALMELDAILFTGDGTLNGIGCIWHASYGWMNATKYSGLAAVGFSAAGFFFELGATIGISGPSLNEDTLTPLIAVGCGNNGYCGIGIGDGSYMTSYGTNIAINGGGTAGFLLYPRGGCQLDGGLHCCANGGAGINSMLISTLYLNGPLSGGTAYTTSKMWKNGTYGMTANHAQAEVYIDCGAGTGNANTSGSIYATNGSMVHATAGNAGISATCSPAFGTVGNNNSLIA